MIGPNDIPCTEIVELVTGYLEGGLDETTRTRFELHVVTCQGCENYVDQMRRSIDAVGETVVEEPDAAQVEQLLDAFRGWHSRTLEERG